MERQLTPIETLDTPMDLVSQGATIVKLENETQMAIAIQRPRNEAKILESALHELDLYPSMARKVFTINPWVRMRKAI